MSLEVVGSTGVLVGLLLLRMADRRRRWPLLAGVAVGAAIGFKIWYVVPFVILAWPVDPRPQGGSRGFVVRTARG